MTWNDIYEQQLKEKGEQALASEWLHKKSATQFKIADGVFSGVMTVLSFTAGFFETEGILGDNIKYLSFSVGVLALLQRLFDFSGKGSHHKSTGVNYRDVVTKVTSELAKPREDREDVGTFSKEITNEMTLTNNNAPHVYNWVLRSFYKKYKNTNFAKPATIDQMNAIVINNEKKVQDEQQDVEEPKERENLITSEIDAHIRQKTINPTFNFELSRFQNNDDEG